MVVPALPAAGLAAASAAPSLLRFYDCSKVTSLSAALDLRACDGRANPRAPAVRGGVLATFAPRPCFGLFRRAVRLSRCCARRSPASALGARTLKRDAEPEPGPHVLTTEVANEESVDGPWTDPMVGRNSSTRHPRSLLLRLSPLRGERRRLRATRAACQSSGQSSGTREARSGVCASKAAKATKVR